jgi:hypothetical protein
MPSFAAAPDGPDTRPRLAASAVSIISLSRAARSQDAEGYLVLPAKYLIRVEEPRVRDREGRNVLCRGGLRKGFRRQRWRAELAEAVRMVRSGYPRVIAIV